MSWNLSLSLASPSLTSKDIEPQPCFSWAIMGNLELDSVPSPSRDLPALGAGAGPGRVRFAGVYQLLIGALRWELPLSTRGYSSWLMSLSGSPNKSQPARGWVLTASLFQHGCGSPAARVILRVSRSIPDTPAKSPRSAVLGALAHGKRRSKQEQSARRAAINFCRRRGCSQVCAGARCAPTSAPRAGCQVTR